MSRSEKKRNGGKMRGKYTDSNSERGDSQPYSSLTAAAQGTASFI